MKPLRPLTLVGPTVIRVTCVSAAEGVLSVMLEKDGKKAGGLTFRRAPS
jgi:hypothetical protein